jgi:hypothetical protein
MNLFQVNRREKKGHTYVQNEEIIIEKYPNHAITKNLMTVDKAMYVKLVTSGNICTSSFSEYYQLVATDSLIELLLYICSIKIVA